MRKFLKLVQNEIIKLMKKKSTIVMACLFLVLTIGFVGMLSIDTSVNYSTDEMRQKNFIFQVQYDFDVAKELYTNSLAYDENGDLFAKQQYEYYDFILTNNIRYDDWRLIEGVYTSYLTDKFALENGTSELDEDTLRARIATAETFLRHEDGWKNYCMASLEALADRPNSEAEKWFFTYAMEHNIDPSSKEQYALMKQTRDQKLSLAQLLERKRAGENVSDAQISEYENDLLLSEYRLDHHIEKDISEDVETGSLLNINNIDFWSVFSACRSLIKVVGVMCIAVAGSIVAVEFSQGTYKFLLMSPAKRWKILSAKFLTVLLFGITALAALYLLSLISCVAFFGTADISLPLLSVVNGTVVVGSPFLSVLAAYALSTVEILSMVMLALAISTLVKGNALAISISIVTFLLGSLTETILRSLDVDFGRYLIFANLDLPALYSGASFYPGQTFGFALAVIFCHIAVFGLTAWDAFCRREM